jgi:Lrp/AsnC family transcriptional regulator, leucine-responsive regulatory protein
VQLDAIDRRILQELQQEARLTNLELAERVGLSPSPCLRRVKQLERAGIVRGYGAQLSREALGLDLTVFVAVNLERHGSGKPALFREVVLDMPEVVACYIVSGESDYLLHVVAPNFDAYRRFVIDRLLAAPGVKDIRSSFALDVLKEAAPLPLGHLK